MSYSGYPPGAQFDPNAPFNRRDLEPDECELCEVRVDQVSMVQTAFFGRVQLCVDCQDEHEYRSDS